MSTPTNIRTASEPAVACTVLLAAVKLALDNWADLRASSRQPMSYYLRDPRNELKVFQMVISLNNLQKAYDKAHNDVRERRGPAATGAPIVSNLNGWSPSAPRNS